MKNNLRTDQNSPRKPFVAALMSMALPGLGQLYNGEFNKAIWLFLLFAIASIPLILVIALFLPATLTLPLVVLATLASIGIWVFAMVDGWRVANRLQVYAISSWQTSGVYTLVFLICATVILPSTMIWVRKNQVEPLHAPSRSMEPSVLKGDVFFAQKSYNCPNCWGPEVKRGDVAIFVYPDNRNHYYVKRVVALPGDKVSLKGTTLMINGKRLNTDAEPETETFNGKSWQVQWSDAVPDAAFEVTVEPGHAFVLGDNRSHSNDSRVFGSVPLSDIVAKARQVWFSKSDDGIRWSRIGHMINP